MADQRPFDEWDAMHARLCADPAMTVVSWGDETHVYRADGATCACGATIYQFLDLARDGWWLRHGENDEARVFILRVDLPDWTWDEQAAWLDSIHAYERGGRHGR